MESTTDSPSSSTRPYLIRALHDWCTDNGFTPYLAVYVDSSVRVPQEYVKNHEIVLNVGFEATSGLQLGNEWIEFKARFGGVARDILVPVDHVIAIYARENGQGMAFPVPTPSDDEAAQTGDTTPSPAPEATAATGLRLAPALASTTDTQAAPVPVPVPAPEAPVHDSDEPPPVPPNPGGSPRPALKRVK